MRRMIFALGFALMPLTIQDAGAAGVMYLNGPMPQLIPDKKTSDRGFTPAPVPLHGATLPKPPPPKAGEAEFSGSLRSASPQRRTGEGFSPGSSFNEELQRRNRSATGAGLAPSFQLTVPVEN